jgi:hypothetical protein
MRGRYPGQQVDEPVRHLVQITQLTRISDPGYYTRHPAHLEHLVE